MSDNLLDMAQRAALRAAIAGVLFNASNYPGEASAHMLGQDIGPLTDKVALAVEPLLESLSARANQAETEKAESWVESTEYAYGSLDAPDIITPTGEDIDDLGTAQWHAEEFWLQALERTLRRSPWRTVLSPGTGSETGE